MALAVVDAVTALQPAKPLEAPESSKLVTRLPRSPILDALTGKVSKAGARCPVGHEWKVETDIDVSKMQREAQDTELEHSIQGQQPDLCRSPAVLSRSLALYLWRSGYDLLGKLAELQKQRPSLHNIHPRMQSTNMLARGQRLKQAAKHAGEPAVWNGLWHDEGA